MTKKKSLQYRRATASKEIWEKRRNTKQGFGKGKSKRSQMLHNKVSIHLPWIFRRQKPLQFNKIKLSTGFNKHFTYVICLMLDSFLEVWKPAPTLFSSAVMKMFYCLRIIDGRT